MVLFWDFVGKNSSWVWLECLAPTLRLRDTADACVCFHSNWLSNESLCHDCVYMKKSEFWSLMNVIHIGTVIPGSARSHRSAEPVAFPLSPGLGEIVIRHNLRTIS